MDAIASVRRSGVERWCTTAMEMAKSKAARGCGSERMSATATLCGWCCEAMVTRLEDLGVDLPWLEGGLCGMMMFPLVQYRFCFVGMGSLERRISKQRSSV